jgi:probable phosphoglycerate mutase
MTTIHLARHASYERLGTVIPGWTPGVHLSLVGLLEARALSEGLVGQRIDAVVTSPLERCRETAAFIGARLELPVHIDEAFGEIRFGDWTNRAVAELEPLPEFQAFQKRRSLVRIPGGESMAEVQVRVSLALRLLHESYPDGSVVVVSHGDVIKAAIADVLGLSLDEIDRFRVDPASITTIERAASGARLVRLNDMNARAAGPLARSTRAKDAVV